MWRKVIKMYQNENKLTPDIPYTVEYHIIVCHNKEGLKLAKASYGDYSNRLYLSDNGLEDTISIDTKWDSRLFGEFGFWEWAANNIRECDRACLQHYRRKLPLGVSDIILPQPCKFNMSILDGLAYWHSPVLCDALHSILSPQEFNVLQGNELLCWNIFKAPQPVIKQWVEYCGNKLTLLLSYFGLEPTLESVEKFVQDKNSGLLEPREGKNIDPNYQRRFMACCLERISHCYWMGVPYPREYKQIKLLQENQRI